MTRPGSPALLPPLLLLTLLAVAAGPPPLTLEADVPLAAEQVAIGRPARYELAGLQPNSNYEVRVSYRAVTRARWLLRLVALDPRTGQVCADPPKRLRRLLDTEKVMFDTDAAGHIKNLVVATGEAAAAEEGWRYAVDITAEQDAVTPNNMALPETVRDSSLFVSTCPPPPRARARGACPLVTPTNFQRNRLFAPSD